MVGGARGGHSLRVTDPIGVRRGAVSRCPQYTNPRDPWFERSLMVMTPSVAVCARSRALTLCAAASCRPRGGKYKSSSRTRMHR